MRSQELGQALEITQAAVTEAGVELRQHFGNIKPETKGDGSGVKGVVTALDRKVESLLAERLGIFDDGIGFSGEEFGVQSKAATTWLVDPIDGTAHFIRGVPLCTTMVALIEDNEVVMSVIHDFVRRDTYWAIKEQGAHKNGKRIHVSNRTLEQGLVSFESKLDKPDDITTFLKLGRLTTLMATINCGIEFAMVASGKWEGRISVDPYAEDWDIAPGSLIVAEAGGVVRNVGEDAFDYRNHDCFAVNPVIFEELTSGDDALFPQN
jgi:myo-inositol-1(or 4)-monophosphatase